MISFKEAKKIAEENIPSDHLIVETIEKPYGWYFLSNPRKYIETGDIDYLVPGDGGLIVEKESGRIECFGSALSLEQNFKYYEMKLANLRKKSKNKED